MKITKLILLLSLFLFTSSGFAATGSDTYVAGPLSSQADPLPVELSSFTCTLSEGTPYLQWITQTETANAGWNVYRSLSAEEETAMQINNAFIAGHGTTSEPSQYSFYDDYSLQYDQTYYYWLESINYSGDTEKHGPVSLYLHIDQEDEEPPQVPTVSSLKANFPNPFNPTTKISYDLASAGVVELNIYNYRGQLVESLLNEYKEPGNYSILWQAENLASGIYFCQMKIDSHTESYKKMILLK